MDFINKNWYREKQSQLMKIDVILNKSYGSNLSQSDYNNVAPGILHQDNKNQIQEYNKNNYFLVFKKVHVLSKKYCCIGYLLYSLY